MPRCGAHVTLLLAVLLLKYVAAGKLWSIHFLTLTTQSFVFTPHTDTPNGFMRHCYHLLDLGLIGKILVTEVT